MKNYLREKKSAKCPAKNNGREYKTICKTKIKVENEKNKRPQDQQKLEEVETITGLKNIQRKFKHKKLFLI